MNSEIECLDCDGHGVIWNNNDPTSGQSADCDACNGAGWRQPTADEAAYLAEAEHLELCSGEPPVTQREREATAWSTRQGLR